MLVVMMAKAEESVTIDELKSLIFANSDMNLLSNTLQGVEETGEVQQNWLCSSTEVPSLNNRVVGICRMKNFTNMGESSHEVKYFVLILCPTNIKGNVYECQIYSHVIDIKYIQCVQK